MSAGSNGATNLLEFQKHCSDVGYRITDGTFPRWVLAQGVRSFTFGPYKLLMKKAMEVIIHRMYFSEYPFQFKHKTKTQHSSGLVVTTTLPE